MDIQIKRIIKLGNLVIPVLKGEKGDKGEQGIQGIPRKRWLHTC